MVYGPAPSQSHVSAGRGPYVVSETFTQDFLFLNRMNLFWFFFSFQELSKTWHRPCFGTWKLYCVEVSCLQRVELQWVMLSFFMMVFIFCSLFSSCASFAEDKDHSVVMHWGKVFKQEGAESERVEDRPQKEAKGDGKGDK